MIYFSLLFKLECIARIHKMYQENVVNYIEEDRPHVLTSSSNSNGHAANNFMSDEEYKKGKLFFIIIIKAFILFLFICGIET